MKQLILFVICLIIAQTSAFAENIPFSEYINKPYIGMSYNKALHSTRPFLLIFASNNNVNLIPQLLPIAQFVYNNYYHYYNFSILNVEKENNAHLANLYKVKTLPTAFIVDPKSKTFIKINPKHYNIKDLDYILNNYLIKKHYK